MDYQLVVIVGRSPSQTLKLADGVTTVGRQEDCQLRIRSSQVSRKHCELFEKKGLLLLKDLGSSNGTHVNGKKVEGQRVLEPGDILTIGNVRLRVEKIGAATTAPTAPGKPTTTPAKKPADTAVAEAALGITDSSTDDEDFEIDFDEGPADDATTSVASTAKSKPEPATKASEPAEPATAELADDAVADFLMNINLEDEP